MIRKEGFFSPKLLLCVEEKVLWNKANAFHYFIIFAGNCVTLP